ncbi:MAG TPA: hypothetical protein VFZ42_04310 [Chitinophagaceae bacterium]
MKKLFAIAASILFLASCNKKESDAPGVWVRLENKTPIILESAQVGNTHYGDVSVLGVTEYQLVKEPLYAGFCTFEINGQISGAGYGICGTPPLPPPLKNGYYTFRVEPAQGYFTVVVRR